VKFPAHDDIVAINPSMSSLYHSLSEIYEGMYQTFINYDDEFRFYSKILSSHQCESLVEIGCGTGHLAQRFTQGKFQYSGLDLSEDMLTIARRKTPDAKFMAGDMRDFHLADKQDSCIITGRTLSYLITNMDVLAMFKSVHQNLKSNGIVCFDLIDALKFIPKITTEKIQHTAVVNGERYSRDSYWKINPSQSWTFDWLSVYQRKKDDGSYEEIGRDNSTIRSFTEDEITLFLTLTGFEVKNIIVRPSYAFDTLVFVAQRK
jgi:SAM-dependent methyltransferase